ncbi:threonine-phosphate decarboxylase CobD [Paludibacterium purpuratum]|uniref:Putative 8-amino-7-oxononanoate synthase n=1 Tax=Paludibacterium purpuratum TaxID=1144873 RepID=A0A4R7B7X5_9NEIS|nr:threonine-phosphate decarboxylase CobD [Paludibacterium purpuratum]TDR79826.1 L-threonine O-3-phosphate decarboxylase [Paludibacterium purpuratum]
MLEHGGGILAAAQRYGIAAEDWVDLSTGLNPHGWPVPAVDARAWQRLPEPDDGLENAATAFYGTEAHLAVAGSQAAIQALPRLRAPCRVGLLDFTYAEHPYAWQRQGHRIERLSPDAIDAQLDQLDVLQLTTPNNPTGWLPEPRQLHDWLARLAARGGWLLLDETFLDVTPERSLLPLVGQPGLIVLRSIGKFFGLAGARAGFVFAWPALLQALQEELGPWALAGPTRQAVRLALQDRDWHAAMRERLPRESIRLAALLSEHGLTPDGGSPMFQWLRHNDAAVVHRQLARQGVWVRLFAEPASLRFGLPADETAWARLAQALSRS